MVQPRTTTRPKEAREAKTPDCLGEASTSRLASEAVAFDTARHELALEERGPSSANRTRRPGRRAKCCRSRRGNPGRPVEVRPRREGALRADPHSAPNSVSASGNEATHGPSSPRPADGQCATKAASLDAAAPKPGVSTVPPAAGAIAGHRNVPSLKWNGRARHGSAITLLE